MDGGSVDQSVQLVIRSPPANIDGYLDVLLIVAEANCYTGVKAVIIFTFPK